MSEDWLHELHEELDVFAQKLQTAKIHLEISQTLLEDKKKRAMASENVFQNHELNFWKLNSIIVEV
jgi:hypothetical protein